MLQPEINNFKSTSECPEIFIKSSFIPEITIYKDENVDDLQVSKAIREIKKKKDMKKTFFKKFRFFIVNKWWIHSKEKKILEYLRNKCLVSLNCIDPYHEQLFQDYWALSYPDYPEINRISSNWKLLGFQNDDPRCDFKCGGLITLENMIYFAEQYRDIFKEILKESQRYLIYKQNKALYNNRVSDSYCSSFSNTHCNTSEITTPCRTPTNIQQRSNENISIISTPLNLSNQKKIQTRNKNVHLFLPKIAESNSMASDLTTEENIQQIDEINVSYPLSAALINISIMICLYLNLLPNIFRIPGVSSQIASRRAQRNFIKLCNNFSTSTLSELFCVCAIRFHTEWLEIVKYLGHKDAVSEFDKVLKNVQMAMAQTIENLPKDIIEFRKICNIKKYL